MDKPAYLNASLNAIQLPQDAVVIHQTPADSNTNAAPVVKSPVPQGVQMAHITRQKNETQAAGERSALEERIGRHNQQVERFNHVQAAKWSGALLGLSGVGAIAGAEIGALGSPVLLTILVATGAGGLVLALRSCGPAARVGCKALSERDLDQEHAEIEAARRSPGPTQAGDKPKEQVDGSEDQVVVEGLPTRPESKLHGGSGVALEELRLTATVSTTREAWPALSREHSIQVRN